MNINILHILSTPYPETNLLVFLNQDTIGKLLLSRKQMTTPESKQQYDPQQTARFFNEYGDKEWERFEGALENKINLHLHRYYLNTFVPREARVLEIGAGPGRFTQTLAGLGCRVVVADISQEQLKLNEYNAHRYGYQDAVQEWVEVDITDMSRFSDGEFEVVVAYGGPFSYALDLREKALSESIRVLQPGGILLLSVMSLWGTCHRNLNGIMGIDSKINRKIIETGDITPDLLPDRGQYMHMFRSGELHTWLRTAGMAVLVISASGVLVTGWEDKDLNDQQDPEKLVELLHMELEASKEPGARDMGTHLIAVARKTDN